MAKKKSFLERLTGSIRFEDSDGDGEFEMSSNGSSKKLDFSSDTAQQSERNGTKEPKWEEEIDAELTVDVYQTPTDVVVQAMVAGVRPEDLELTLSRDMITIRGKREESRTISEDNFFAKELYWGSFSRTILLPTEVDPEEAEAVEKHGLLTIKLPKIDKDKKTNVRVKSV